MKEDQKKLIIRLSRIEGQVRGIKRMVEEGRDCEEIITQILAAKEACSHVGLEIVKNNFCSCKKVENKEVESLFKLIK